MSKRFLILCISITLCGIALFVTSIFLIKETSQLFGWCIGLGAAFIVLGLGFLLRSAFDLMSTKNTILVQDTEAEMNLYKAKERAGYLVCKIMMVLLCIYILILKNMDPDSFILFLSIALVVLQYLLELILQLFYTNK